MSVWYSCSGCGTRFVKEEWETYGCPECGRRSINKLVKPVTHGPRKPRF